MRSATIILTVGAICFAAAQAIALSVTASVQQPIAAQTPDFQCDTAGVPTIYAITPDGRKKLMTDAPDKTLATRRRFNAIGFPY
jgi:hypothetical protein